MERKSSENGSTAIIISAIVVVLLIICVVVFVKLARHKSLPTYSQTYNTTLTPTSAAMQPTVVPTGTAASKDGSDPQLDKDLQDVQGNMNKLDTDLNTSDQSLNNTSQDTPQ